jgi:flagellar motor protein MotB
MANEDKRPIVIKRIKKVVGGAHGGAWKIAYADFVTAMMAFFLLMWLLGSTTKGDLNGVLQNAAESGVDGRHWKRRQFQHHQGWRAGPHA